MSRIIGSPSSVTAQKYRRTFRITFEIGGTDAVPIYTMIGHEVYETRDAAGNVLGSDQTRVDIPISDAQIPSGLRTGIANLVARFDTVTLPGEP